jgi:hypothetical protein
MYYRIFPTPNMKKVAIALVGLGTSWWFIIMFVQTFRCRPLEAAFQHALQSTAQCLDLNRYFIANCACNVLSDVLILAMPVPAILKLRVSTSQKFMIAGIFLSKYLHRVSSTLAQLQPI